MKITTRTESTNNGNVFQSWETSYDWSRDKNCLLTNSFCEPGQYMVICDISDGPGMRFYFDSQARAMVFVQRWMEAAHDRTPQPKFNAHGAQCGWWKPTYEAEQLRWAISQVLARADDLAAAIKKAETSDPQ